MKIKLPAKLLAVFSFITLTGAGTRCPAAGAAPFAGRMGVEASGDAFVDLVKQNYRWEKADGHGGYTKLTRADVDDHGWPKTDCHWVIDFRPCAEWAGEIDDPEAYRIDRSGVYKCSFDGKAAPVGAGGNCSVANQQYNAGSNRTTFDLVVPKPGPNVGLIVLDFKNAQRSPNAGDTGIAHLRIVRPGYPADSTQVFTNEYLACLKSAAFSAIRFMGVTNTNGNVEWGKDHTNLQHWSNRKLPDDASVESIEPLNKKDGWPWEYTIALCNDANMDAWINIPMSVDDEYIRELARLFKAQLKPGLNMYLEHSNEVWNFGFIQYAWNKVRAKEEVAEGGVRYDFDHVHNEEIWGQRRHAQCVKNAVERFGEVFGPAEINHRIRGVLAGVTPEPEGFFVGGRLSGMLDYLRATGSAPKDWIYTISIPAYYGGKSAAGEAGTEHATVDQIIADMRDAIQQTKKDRSAVAALAKRFELPGGFCAYESGPDIGGGRKANVGNRILAIRDPRQADLYKTNYADAFWSVGGNVAMQFTLSSSYSRFGAWGLTDDVSKPDRNALFQAVRELSGTGR